MITVKNEIKQISKYNKINKLPLDIRFIDELTIFILYQTMNWKQEIM